MPADTIYNPGYCVGSIVLLCCEHANSVHTIFALKPLVTSVDNLKESLAGVRNSRANSGMAVFSTEMPSLEARIESDSSAF